MTVPQVKKEVICFICLTVFSGCLLLMGIYMYFIYGEQKFDCEQLIAPPIARNALMMHVSRACEFLENTSLIRFQESIPAKYSEWLYSERYKLASCKNKKVAHTNIARVLHTLDGDGTTDVIAKGGFARKAASMPVLNSNKTEERIDLELRYCYKTFMFVRDPLERVLSAYRDHRPAQWFGPGGVLSFKEFLEIVVSYPANESGNLHVAPYHRQCNPCGMKYDYIGMVENFENDMRVILDSVGAEKNIVPQRNQTYHKERTKSEIVKTYIKDVPKTLMKKFYVKYYWDYFIFGYPKPEF